MPKEIVLGEQLTDDEAEGLVQVGWQDWPISHVQVATFSRAKVTHETIWDGFFVTLDRHQINQLIRNLRKARDRAFGRDE